MTEARVLRCPGCGAAADPESARCAYCQARLALVSCPSCFARVFDGSAFCQFCGAASARGDATPSEAPCPSCQTVLHRVEVGKTTLLECPACDGIWVEAAAFEALCADHGAQTPVLHHLAPRSAAVHEPSIRYRPCVECGKMMNRVNFGRQSGTIVDVCRGHGTFLDAGELHAVLTFIRDGGLDRARAKELQDLRDERRRLEAARRGRETPRARGASPFAEPPQSQWDARSLLELLGLLKRS